VSVPNLGETSGLPYRTFFDSRTVGKVTSRPVRREWELESLRVRTSSDALERAKKQAAHELELVNTGFLHREICGPSRQGRGAPGSGVMNFQQSALSSQKNQGRPEWPPFCFSTFVTNVPVLEIFHLFLSRQGYFYDGGGPNPTLDT